MTLQTAKAINRGDALDGAPHASDDVNTNEARASIFGVFNIGADFGTAAVESALTLPANALVLKTLIDVTVADAAETINIGFAGGAELASTESVGAVAVVQGALTNVKSVAGGVVTYLGSNATTTARATVYVEYIVVE